MCIVQPITHKPFHLTRILQPITD